MKRRHGRYQKSALQLIEEAVHLLRSEPGRLLPVYFLGGVPFVLGLLYFWADMSRSAVAGQHLVRSALGMAILFVWMKFWQVVFACRLRALITAAPVGRWSMRRAVSVAATQALIQPTRFFVLPAAALVMLPFGFCYAFYQNVTAWGSDDDLHVTSTWRRAWRQAGHWPRQNHLLIAIGWLFGFVIMANLVLAALILPQLAKSLLGVDSRFTLSGPQLLLNSTFWVTILGVSYLCLDPLIKASYVLRCFYGSAVATGEDLAADLKRLMPATRQALAGLMVVVFSSLCLGAAFEPPPRLPPQQLERAIEKTIAQPEFAWRLPRLRSERKEEKDKGALQAAVSWIMEKLAAGIRGLEKWVGRFFDWLEKLLPQPSQKAAALGGDWTRSVRLVMGLLVVVLVLLVLAYGLWRLRRQRRTAPITAGIPPAAGTPDLQDEGTRADELPIERWLALAGELSAKGQLRLAMRALYLATLARLAEREMLTIESYKSNGEYERELQRRTHVSRELPFIFSKSLRIFERVWYGEHDISGSDFDHFAATQKRIMAFAEK